MLDILIVLILGAVTGWLGKCFGMPAAVWQLGLGAIIGPAVLGWISPSLATNILAETGPSSSLNKLIETS